MNTTETTGALPPEQGVSTLYRAVWRWHFYAGLIVLPFMIIIAVTGALYLFKDEINDAFYGNLRLIEAQATTPLPASTLVANALTAFPGKLKAYAPSDAPDRAAQVKIVSESGEKNVTYVDPFTGAVMGSAWDAGFAGSSAMWVVRKLHSLEYFGWLGNRVIEAVAGWSVLLVVSGLYLWWPRGRDVGVYRPRKTKGRAWWRDIHAVTGAYAAIFIVFLAMTGLPWSGVWGKQFYDLSYSVGLGMPDGYWDKYPTSSVPTGEALDRAPWILENQPMPVSIGAEGVPQGLDAILKIVEDMGIHPGYTLNTPGGPEGVITASVYPDDVTFERVIHLDQYTGEILFDMSLANLGALGRAAEWGISVHMGQEFGVINQIVMLLACIAIVLMAVSAIVIWWKRRPAGSLGVPSVPSDRRIPVGVLAIAVIAGIFFPLVGLSLLVVLAIELALWARQREAAA